MRQIQFSQEVFAFRIDQVSESLYKDDKKMALQYYSCLLEGYQRALLAGVPALKVFLVTGNNFSAQILRWAQNAGFHFAESSQLSCESQSPYLFWDIKTENDLESFKKQLSKSPSPTKDLFVSVTLTPSASDQKKFQQEIQRFEHEIGPTFYKNLILLFLEFQIYPKLLCIKGFDRVDDYREISDFSQSKKIRLLLECRGEEAKVFRKKMSLAVKVKQFSGFVLGSNIYGDLLDSVSKSKITWNEASEQIAQRFKSHCDEWIRSKTQN